MEKSGIWLSHEDDAEWEIWYQDNFDMESPRQLEIAGQGLVKGLTELWKRHLYETITPNRGAKFSHFNLWCKKNKSEIKIEGDVEGLLKIRQWVFGKNGLYEKSFKEITDRDLLNLIANTHWKLLLDNKTSEYIAAIANYSNSVKDFKNRITS